MDKLTVKHFEKVRKRKEFLDRCTAEQTYAKHWIENREKSLGLSETEVVVNAMIEFKNTK